jgi:hypothetical protein
LYIIKTICTKARLEISRCHSAAKFFLRHKLEFLSDLDFILILPSYLLNPPTQLVPPSGVRPYCYMLYRNWLLIFTILPLPFNHYRQRSEYAINLKAVSEWNFSVGDPAGFLKRNGGGAWVKLKSQVHQPFTVPNLEFFFVE